MSGYPHLARLLYFLSDKEADLLSCLLKPALKSWQFLSQILLLSGIWYNFALPEQNPANAQENIGKYTDIRDIIEITHGFI